MNEDYTYSTVQELIEFLSELPPLAIIGIPSPGLQIDLECKAPSWIAIVQLENDQDALKKK
jgi:hypothetical protein